ncbi:Gfo/Idh/MocA family oxidoreductase [Amycolatopsis mongoliensis]|uniref:Gfo/Idh/MocA family oxidoreductase n=1 Tax=Amycolatopsis mongoliensis TaxID=715475 RepID=A0A9Y2JNI3_9PSEU|nr:Gfo/Idh/MocA family oxidoreductase [Amycolatopsis sp. 4-36]WIY00955.1 Gfo/Idh/MocA family oxidoreductase [Amycolatopsis sp. 4-36]
MAIVGVDSSRPARLLDFFAAAGNPALGRVTHVVGLDGTDPEPLARRYGVTTTVRDVRDLPGSVDAALLCTRDGREHAAQALPLLAAGIPVWVDKPLATREADARAMTREAVARGLLLACRSGFRDADAVRAAAMQVRAAEGPASLEITGPAAPDSPYGGLAHYGIHHVELACEVLEQARGGRPRSVAEVTADSARLVGDDVTLDLRFRPPAECTGFTLAVNGDVRPVTAPARYLEEQVEDFLTGIGEGRGTRDPEALVDPVRLLEGILTTG